MMNKTTIKEERHVRRTLKRMAKEAERIVRTFDYTNYDISAYYDLKNNTLIIPKPVFALSFVDYSLGTWIEDLLERLPNGSTVCVADDEFIANNIDQMSVIDC